MKRKEYLVELNWGFDYYVESYLYSNDVIVIEGNDGDTIIKISTDIPKTQIVEKCSVDIKRILE